MALVCEIVSVGTELLLGSIANTDARDISRGLAEAGIHCYFHTTVGDNDKRLSEALRIAQDRADIIITTGGLGPTCDDITKQTVCQTFGVPLELHSETWERILAYFERIGRPVTENNRQQAMVPKGGIVFENDWGTAPGCGFHLSGGAGTEGGKSIYLLPGPPKECMPMFNNCLLPILKKMSGTVIVSRNINVFGMGESEVEDLLRPLMEAATNPTLAPYANGGEVTLRVTASAETAEEAFTLTEPMVAEVSSVLGDLVYGVDEQSLAGAALKLLDKSGCRLAVAESCTGGLTSSRLTSVPGASKSFLGGVVAYATDVKTGLLHVPEETVAQYGSVSDETALAMARGVCEATGAELGLGITGLAGPASDGSGVELGTVCIALYDRRDGSCEQVRRNFGDERGRVRNMSSLTALDFVRRKLTGHP